MTITYGSVCSGIESASRAWGQLGMRAAWFSEIEPFPCSVLAHHWPHVPNLGDMTALPLFMRCGLLDAPDILVGGTPCQAFSVAGKRESLDDARGQLTITYVRLLDAIDEQRPGNEAVCVWENVPGVLNTKDNAFGCFLGELSGSGCELQPAGKRWTNAGCVFGPKRAIAWRVLDAQYFGLAQRRKRVFVVASARDGFDPGEVLFEREGVRRDSPPSRKAQENPSNCVTAGVGNADRDAQTGHLIHGSHWDGENPHPTLNQSNNTGGVGGSNQEVFSQRGAYLVQGHGMVAFGEYATDETASTMKARDYKDATDLVVHGTQDPCTSSGRAFALGRNNGAENCVVQGVSLRGRGAELGEPEVCNTLRASTGGSDKAHAVTATGVRRLMPVECERLQGFPDGHTDVPHRGKPAFDGPRYKAIGNSKAVDCIAWVGGRVKRYLESGG